MTGAPIDLLSLFVCNLYPTSRIKTIDNHLNMRYMRIYFRGPYS